MSQPPQRFKDLMRQVRLTRRSLLGRLAALGVAIPAIGPLIAARRREQRAAGAAGSAGNSIFDPSFDVAHFDFAHLIRVKPLGQSMVAGDSVITVTSLEIYQDGFNALLLVKHDDMTSPVLLGAFPVVIAQDNHGMQYHGKMRSGAGGGDWMRVTYSFAPALDPAAESLSFVIRWVQPPVSSSPETGVVYDEENVVDGPWRITVSLAEMSSNDQNSQAESNLQRVVPVAQHQEVSGFSITLYSLELYGNNFEGVIRSDWTSELRTGPMPMPSAKWFVRDDRGTEYRKVNSSGGGGGLPPDPETGIWRQSSRVADVFKPVIDSYARTLILEIPEIRMVLFDPDVSPPTPEVTDIITGPWRFEVQL